MQVVVTLVFLTSLHLSYVAGLDCLTCSLISQPGQCANGYQCLQGEVCSVKRFSSSSGPAYNLSCETIANCQGNFKVNSQSLVGRRDVNDQDNYDVIDKERCFSCCDTNLCNMHGCSPNNHLPNIDVVTWSPWNAWTLCSKTCDGGVRIRGRTCMSAICPGPTYEQASCNDAVLCHGVTTNPWSAWQQWLPCPATCGADNIQVRSRSCVASSCSGSGSDIRYCNNNPCPAVNGNWAQWSQWSKCSSTCGTGSIHRTRTCSNPPPSNGGKACSNPTHHQDTLSCNIRACAVDGQWSSWLQWSQCSVSCDEGIKFRVRACSNPAPAHGGKDCTNPGTNQEITLCTSRLCPVDGQWSSWLQWSPCSVSCDEGIKVRIRACTNPATAHGGKDCANPGSNQEFTHCTSRLCPVDGQWSSWLQWSPCSVSCDEGIKVRIRACSNPAPAHGGKDCANPGSNQEFTHCTSRLCPVDGQWSSWSPWATCSTTCGGGTTSRMRTCTFPAPSHGGKPCDHLNHSHENGTCNTTPCPDPSITRCFKCTHVSHPGECGFVEECTSTQMCAMEQIVTQSAQVLYNSGCKSKLECGITSRRDVIHQQASSDLTVCIECCHGQFCNNKGCGVTALTQPQRGPICFQCHGTLDPRDCRNVITCDAHQTCAVIPSLFGGPTRYTSDCMPAAQCSAIRGHKRDHASPFCCGTDFCNDHAGSVTHVVTPPTTTTTTTTTTTATRTTTSPTSPSSTTTTTTTFTAISQHEMCARHRYHYDTQSQLCYKLHFEHKSWDNANAVCKNEGGTLAIIDTQAKWDFLKVELELESRYANQNIFIGGHDTGSHSTSFTWADGSHVTFADWSPGDPGSAAHGCITLQQDDDFRWHDTICQNKLLFICTI